MDSRANRAPVGRARSSRGSFPGVRSSPGTAGCGLLALQEHTADRLPVGAVAAHDVNLLGPAVHWQLRGQVLGRVGQSAPSRMAGEADRQMGYDFGELALPGR